MEHDYPQPEPRKMGQTVELMISESLVIVNCRVSQLSSNILDIFFQCIHIYIYVCVSVRQVHMCKYIWINMCI